MENLGRYKSDASILDPEDNGDDDDDVVEEDVSLDSNDPRLSQLFAATGTATTVNGNDDEPPAARQKCLGSYNSSRELLSIDENAIMTCWNWSLEQHNTKSPEAVGFWISPQDPQHHEASVDHGMDDENEAAETRLHISQWKPASLQIPSWVTTMENPSLDEGNTMTIAATTNNAL